MAAKTKTTESGASKAKSAKAKPSTPKGEPNNAGGLDGAEQAKGAPKKDYRLTQFFRSEAEFVEAANGYFADCDNDVDEKGLGRLYSEDGLCLWLTEHNSYGRTVSVKMLQGWRAGESCKYLQDAVEKCYLRICAQMASDPRIVRAPGRYAFDRKQEQFGGYKDKVEQSGETKVTIVHGSSVDESDFA